MSTSMPAQVLVANTPTQDLWGHFQVTFDYLNETLFQNQLPHCMLNFATHRGSNGFFTEGRWIKMGQRDDVQTAHEISLNPFLLNEPKEDALSWLTRLMTHLWQRECGKYWPQQQGYYNREFTEQLESIGLPCSDDGTPEGKKTGFKMRHWIEPDGPYEKAIAAMPDEYFPWKGDQKPKAPPRTIYKYRCPTCGVRFSSAAMIAATCNTKACDTLFELVN